MQKTLTLLVIAALASNGCSYRVASGVASTGGSLMLAGGATALLAASAPGGDPHDANQLGGIGVGAVVLGAAVGLVGIIGMVVYDPSPTNATTPSGGTVTIND